MSARARFGLVLALLTVAICVLGYWQTDWVEKEIDAGYGEAAERNDFLAAELFLARLGLEVETVTGMTLLDELPSTDDMLFLSAPRESLSARRREALTDWVERGGELLVVARSVYDRERERSDDALLDGLGVFLLGPDAEAADAEETAESPKPAEPSAPEGGPADRLATDEEGGDAEASQEAHPRTLAELLSATRDPQTCLEVGEQVGEQLDEVSVGGLGRILLELSSVNELAVNEEDLEAAYFSKRDQVLSLPVGEGRVIAVTSASPFANRRIGCHDHAFFLWFASRHSNKVWLLHDPDVPSLGELVWRELPASTAAGLLLIVLFVASHSLRFGVPEASDEAPRRELREHLEASVTFQFRKGDFEGLFERLRADLIRRGPIDSDRWAERAGISSEEARHVLVEPVPRKRREILKRIRTMLRMRRTR